ncbi:MAG: FtsX-like permease family protein [Methanobacteriota archaeon]|nr:MAG: FtsX-like permease family protein [Euryarchaeota archaeon]
MFVVASFSIVSGLQTSMESLAGNFEEEYLLVTHQGVNGPTMFDRTEVDSVVDAAAFGLFTFARVEPADTSLTAFCLVDEGAVMGESLVIDGNETLAGTALDISGYQMIEAAQNKSILVSGEFSSSIVSSSWLLCSHDLMMSLTSAEDSDFNFAVVKAPSSEQIEMLQDDGFSVQPMLSILGFLESGTQGIRSAAMWVLIPSSFVVAVLVYSFLGSETADRRREIGILKAMGASKKRILAYLFIDTFLITAWGAALGLALGIILSYGIATMSAHMFTSVFVIEIEEWLLLLAYGMTLIAGIAGTIIPSVRSTRASPASDLQEVGRF